MLWNSLIDNHAWFKVKLVKRVNAFSIPERIRPVAVKNEDR